jgi:hypothetical protein
VRSADRGEMATSISPETAPPTNEPQAPTVIYVMGAGRSGSTILGVALGNCAGLFYAGELEAWLRRSGVPNFGGEARARFWNAVRQQVGGEELFGDDAWRCLEYSAAPFRLRTWLTRRGIRPRYQKICAELYRAITSVAEVNRVVDTSHYPLRARELQRLRDVDLHLIYLVRDPLSVVASFARKDVTNASKSVAATNAYLGLTHLLAVLVFLRHPSDKRLLLRYEDLVAQPEEVIARILDSVGVSAPLPDLGNLETGVPFQGNRLLESDRIAFRPGGPGAASERPASAVTTLLQSPWEVVWSRLRPRAAVSSARE